MALCSELKHPNIITHVQTHLEDKSIYMIFGYCEHDLLQMIYHHSQLTTRTPIHAETVRSIMYQLLQGCEYLHRVWVMHRDLKPANIMVTNAGRVKIGDLGLARIFREPPASLFAGDKVVVTIWYRAPELVLGARHYTPAVDLWAVGCIFGELLSLKPIFKGDEVKMDNRKTVPFQKNQMQRIVDVLGMPTASDWPTLPQHPEYAQIAELYGLGTRQHRPLGLAQWYKVQLRSSVYPAIDHTDVTTTPGTAGLSFLAALLTYDPSRRIDAHGALQHPYFTGERGRPLDDCFAASDMRYPMRKISNDGGESGHGAGSKRHFGFDDSRPSKKLRAG